MAKNRIIFALWLLLWLATWAQGKGNMAAFKVPSIVEIVEDFPRTCSMKIEKKLLK